MTIFTKGGRYQVDRPEQFVLSTKATTLVIALEDDQIAIIDTPEITEILFR